jgi:tetratricopeptide (TPR) repeat protein
MDPSVARLSALASLGRWNAALEANEVALRLDPYEGAWYIDHAELMIMTGRPAEALALLDRARTLRPDSATVTTMACAAHLLMGQMEQAIAACEKASGRLDYWQIHLTLAAAYANRREIAKAVAARTEVLRTVPGLTIAQLRGKHDSDKCMHLVLVFPGVALLPHDELLSFL